VAFDNVAADLRRETDLFMSGYLIPNILPTSGDQSMEWGTIGSRVRGTCYYYNVERRYGFFRFLTGLKSLWSGPKEPDSPYCCVYFQSQDMIDFDRWHEIPNRQLCFEFTLGPSKKEGELQAFKINLVSKI
jgi:hypothetical protein